MSVLVINGSAHHHSLNEFFALAACEHLKDAGLDARYVAVRSLHLPMYAGDETLKSSVSVQWRQLVAKSDAFVLFTPEYYHAMPAILKNTFEHLEGSELRGKLLLLGGATDTRWGTINAQHSLYALLRTLGVWLMPDELFIANADDAINQAKDSPLMLRLSELCERFVQELSRFKSS